MTSLVVMAFPDPNSSTLAAAKAWLQRHQPAGASIIRITRFNNGTTKTWIATYSATDPFPLPTSQNCVAAKAAFQRAYTGGSVKAVGTSEEESGRVVWSVQSAVKTVTCWTMVSRCITRSVTNKQSAKPKIVKTGSKTGASKISESVGDSVSRVGNSELRTTSIEEIKVQVIDRGQKVIIPLSAYTEDQLPCKLFKGDRNVTRSYTGRTTLTKRLFNNIKSLIKLDNAREVKQQVNQKPKTIQHLKFVKSESAPSCPQRIGAQVPFDYSKLERMYSLSKLRDCRTFSNVRRFIIEVLGIPGHGKVTLKVNPKYSAIELRNIIAADGLPVDESLRSLYVEYCNDRQLCKDAESELKSFALANKL